MKTKSFIALLTISITLLSSATVFAVKPDKPPKLYEPEVVEVDCDVAESVTPVQDVLATLKPVGDVNIVRVTGACDETLTIQDFANLTIQGSSGATFGRVQVFDSGYITIWNVDLVGPYTNPWVGQAAIRFSSAGKLRVISMNASCPIPGGNETGDCIDALALNGPGKVELQDFNLIGDWKVGIQTRNKANVILDGGSISAIGVQIGLRDESYMQISGTIFYPVLGVHAFERSHIHSFVPIDSALVISSHVVGMKADAAAHCGGAYPVAMVGSSLGDGPNLCE